MTNDDNHKMISDARAKIDALDEQINECLVARGEVVDQVAKAKNLSGGRSAKRVDREAAMMRRLKLLPQGKLSLQVREHLWREIVSAFTASEKAFRVFSASRSPRSLQQLFHYFGTSVDCQLCSSVSEAIDLAKQGFHANSPDMVFVDLHEMNNASNNDDWWRKLSSPSSKNEDTYRIIDRCPFFSNGNIDYLILGPIPYPDSFSDNMNSTSLADISAANLFQDQFLVNEIICTPPSDDFAGKQSRQSQEDEKDFLAKYLTQNFANVRLLSTASKLSQDREGKICLRHHALAAFSHEDAAKGLEKGFASAKGLTDAGRNDMLESDTGLTMRAVGLIPSLD